MCALDGLGATERAFLAALPEASRDAYLAYGRLPGALAQLLASACEVVPALDPRQFVEDLAHRIDPGLSPEEALGMVRAGELALAMACARGEPAAIARFETELFDQLALAVQRFRNAAVTLDELRQAMRDRLFVAAPGQLPRIASYQGRGDLRSWVRMATTRYLIDVVRADAARPDPPLGDDQLIDAAARGDDPELAFLKRQYRDEFRAAFAAALSALEPRERNILRHRYLDGLEVAELATIYGLHRVSMSRALTRIRDQLLATIRRDFLRRVGIGREELDEVIALIASQLELSLSGLLRR